MEAQVFLFATLRDSIAARAQKKDAAGIGRNMRLAVHYHDVQCVSRGEMAFVVAAMRDRATDSATQWCEHATRKTLEAGPAS